MLFRWTSIRRLFVNTWLGEVRKQEWSKQNLIKNTMSNTPLET